MAKDAAGYEHCDFHREDVRMRPTREVEIDGVAYTVWVCTSDPTHTKTAETSEG